ncbi:hypothetical protein BGZ65_001835, partial [Modicella reniformis]
MPQINALTDMVIPLNNNHMVDNSSIRPKIEGISKEVREEAEEQEDLVLERTDMDISNDDHRGGQQGRSTNHTYDYDSDDYYNRQGERSTPGYGHGQRQDQGQGRYTSDDRDGHTLSYSTSIASNSSSVLAARSEQNEQNQRQKQPPADGWLVSPTGTERETEILPWSDDEAIVTKAVRSPPTAYMKAEKTVPPILGMGSEPPQTQTRRKQDSDMIKVEVGEATSVIPTTDENFGINFIKNLPSSSSPPPPPPSLGSRYNNSSHVAQSMTGAATSLRAAAAKDDQKLKSSDEPRQEASSNWSGQRISLEDMLSSPPTLSQASRQQAMDSWRTSPPLRAQETKPSFTELKNKRRSSLPDKVVPNWNENAQNWRSSIGQRRPSWTAS